MGFFSLPLISQFSYWTQFGILATLLVISYLHRTLRFIIGTLVSGTLALKILVPLASLVIWVLKGIAWLGFYLFFIQFAYHSALQGIVWLFDDALPHLMNEWAKAQASS